MTGEPSWCIINTDLDNSAFYFSGARFTRVGRRLTLRDLIWQVTLRSSVKSFLLKAVHPFAFTFTKTGTAQDRIFPRQSINQYCYNYVSNVEKFVGVIL